MEVMIQHYRGETNHNAIIICRLHMDARFYALLATVFWMVVSLTPETVCLYLFYHNLLPGWGLPDDAAWQVEIDQLQQRRRELRAEYEQIVGMMMAERRDGFG